MSSNDFIVIDNDNQNRKAFETRAEAEEAAETAREFGSDDVEIVASDSDTETDGGEVLMGVDVCVHCGEEIENGWCPDCDGDDSDEEVAQPTTVDADAVADVERLPDDPDLTDDPFAWMPGDFVDTIEGKPTINRQGYAALAHKFDISAPDISVELGPEETGHEYCRVKATVEDSGGRRFVNHGSAHVDRGDDETLLLELATTRARKRALAGATGVGLIAVEELKNELEDGR